MRLLCMPGPDGINALYWQYQQKHMLYSKDAIIDLMLDDGVINFEQADKLKKGVSIFYEPFRAYVEGNEQTTKPAHIMDYYFNKPKFNREIEYTYQPHVQGDCLQLSDINSLSYTKWGAKAIHDAIIPDEDGSGGVTIHFKGSPISDKKIHLTARQIMDAKDSGNYSWGDDDMIALEFATEITFRQMVKQGIAKRVVDDEHIKSQGGKYRSYIYGGVKTDKFRQYPISELLGIETYSVDFNVLDTSPTVEKDVNRLLKWVAKNKENVSGTCGFNSTFYVDCEPSGIVELRERHAYAIKNIKYGKKLL